MLFYAVVCTFTLLYLLLASTPQPLYPLLLFLLFYGLRIFIHFKAIKHSDKSAKLCRIKGIV